MRFVRIFILIILGMALNFSGVMICKSAQGAKEWNEHKGRHFVIYYKDVPEGFVKEVEDAAEQYYEQIRKNLGFYRYEQWTWENRAIIYIYADQEEYAQAYQSIGWSSGWAAIREKTIRTYPAAHGFFDSVLPHELGHIIFHELIGFHVDVPLWLEEGVAMYQERAKRWGADKIVLNAIEKDVFWRVDELGQIRFSADSPREQIELFYAESASVVNFLIMQYGDYRFLKLCRELKDKKNFNDAFKSAYPQVRTIERLNELWIRYLKRR